MGKRAHEKAFQIPPVAAPRFAIMAERGKDGCSTEPVTARSGGEPACRRRAGRRVRPTRERRWAGTGAAVQRGLVFAPPHRVRKFLFGYDGPSRCLGHTVGLSLPVRMAGKRRRANRQRRYAGTGAAMQRGIVFTPPHRVRKLFFSDTTACQDASDILPAPFRCRCGRRESAGR